MTGTRYWIAALACALVACSSGPAARTSLRSPSPGAAREATAGRASATTTPRAAAPTTTTAAATHPARPRVLADRTPPPRIHNTGTDYVAIYLSLDRYRSWLESHHPDPALVPRVWVTGTAIARRFERHLGDLQRHHVRWVDVGDHSVARVVSVVDHTVTLTVDEHTTGIELLDASGRVIDRARQGPVLRYVVLLDADSTGHWQVASVEPRLTNDVEVQL